MRYGPHKEFVAPARAKSELWRTAAGLILASAAQLGLVYVLFGAVSLLIGEAPATTLFRDIFYFTLGTRDTLLLLASTGFLTIGLWAVVNQLHQRSALSLLGHWGDAWSDFWAVTKTLCLLALLLALLPERLEPQPNLEFGRWLILLPLALPALFIQISSEELLFRGYLQQQLAARFKSTWIWMGLPTLIFALGHYDTELAGQNALVIALWAGLFGLAAADLTARSGNLGAALALHLVNNALAILFYSAPGPVSGLSLYIMPIALDSPELAPVLLVDLGILLVSWLAARVALRV